MSPNLYGVLTVALVSIAPTANVTTLRSPGQQHAGRFGQAVSAAGDVDGDGFSDVIVGAPGELTEAGRAYVFSGRTAAPLFGLGLLDPDAMDGFGTSVSGAGDVNQDGLADVIVGAFNEEKRGRAYVYAGAEGHLLFNLAPPRPEVTGFGEAVAAAGDVDRDGHPDVIVSGSAGTSGRVYVISGDDGSLLLELMSPNDQPNGFFGSSVAGVGDLDDDGSPDVIAGAWQEDSGGPGGPQEAGRAYAFSGRDGSLLFELQSPNEQPNGGFGFSAAGLGDISGDGVPDLAVGALDEDVDGVPNAGRVYAFSGRDGGFLVELQASQPVELSEFGGSLSGMGDLNGDGLGEVVVGQLADRNEPSAKDGRAFIFDGHDGRLIRELRSPRRRGRFGLFGFAVSGAGDVDQDGLPDVIVGALGEGSEVYGRAYIFSSLAR